MLFLFFIMDVSLGSVLIHPQEIWNALTSLDDANPIREIIINYRLPKALTAILIGGCLSTAGVLMQTLFRNPLAGPDVLGVNAGAGLGVALAALIATGGISSIIISNWGFMGASFAGALIVLAGVMLLSNKIENNVALLIAGIMFGNVASALVSIIQNVSNPDAIKLFIVWSFGSLSGVTWEMLQVIIPLTLLGLLFALLMRKGLNALLLGENYASGLGIKIRSLRLKIVLVTALLAGTATVFAGPIGFIGIIVPHLCRWYLGDNEHGRLLPFAFLTGSVLLLVCDIISQLPGYSGTLPINSITSLLGAPVVVYIIIKRKDL